MKFVELNCSGCKKIFSKKLKVYNASLKKNPNRKFYCSVECTQNRIKLNCTQCGCEVIKNPSAIQKVDNVFCSTSCAGKFNNHKFPKRQMTRKCIKCDSIRFNTKTDFCKIHYEEFKATRREGIEKRTVGYYRSALSLKGLHKSSLHAHVRLLARSWFRYLTKNPCVNCGYTKHVELCHLKSISSFKDSALIKEINCKENLLPLCRNCHWELDHGLLTDKWSPRLDLNQHTSLTHLMTA